MMGWEGRGRRVSDRICRLRGYVRRGREVEIEMGREGKKRRREGTE